MITPSDFGVFLTNLPQKEEADTVKAFLEENVEDVEISYVNYAYKIEDIVRESRKEMKLQNMKMFV
jgi:phage shock protein PspC (stress-responsive transcriptional regulator)